MACHTEAATSIDGIGGMSSTNQTTIANGVQTPTRHTPEDRPGTGRVQAKCPLHTGSSISHPGHVHAEGREVTLGRSRSS